MELLNVFVSSKRAVFINGTRITSRGTKWGNHWHLDEFTCTADQVLQLLLERGPANGYAGIVIDDEYAAEFGI